MEQTPLTHLQKKAIAMVVAEPKLAGFYLSGGTALAAYFLHHRISDDLDFFIFDEVDTLFLHTFAERMKTTCGAKKVRCERLHDRNLFFFSLDDGQELKMEFTHYPFRQFEEPKKIDGLRVDSLRDISANKLMALLDRFDPKDFVDLFFLLHTFSLDAIRHDAEEKFGAKIGDIFLGGELVKVRRIEALPKMLKSLTVEELKNFFAARAKELKQNIF